jgi:phosphoserine phosphatase RsbU/P
LNNSNTYKQNEPRFTKTIRDDFKHLKFQNDIGSEYRDLKDYYLTDERKKRLESMSRFKRFFAIPWWLLKALFFRLTPFRRILLLFSILMLLISGNNRIESGQVTIDLFGPGFIGGLVLLFILALELKDKLLARTELEEGRAIQKALMPERSPKIDGWDIWLYTQSANEVGGDLLDLIKINENRYGLAIGDVSGKGLSAALMMAKLQATIRALVPDYNSLNDLGFKLNEIFQRDGIRRIFASLLYLEFKPSSGEMEFINSGHFPPLLIDKGKVTQLAKDAPALGILKSPSFNKQNLKLEIDQTIVLYSDGVTEAANEYRDLFGNDRLTKILSENYNLNSEKLGEKILNEIKMFAGNAKYQDDLTIAILKYTA